MRTIRDVIYTIKKNIPKGFYSIPLSKIAVAGIAGFFGAVILWNTLSPTDEKFPPREDLSQYEVNFKDLKAVSITKIDENDNDIKTKENQRGDKFEKPQLSAVTNNMNIVQNGTSDDISDINLAGTSGVGSKPSKENYVELNNLGRACLPERGRMEKDAPIDPSICHCPPKEMCGQTINDDKGKEVPKLPLGVRQVCCDPYFAPPPPPPPPPSPSPTPYNSPASTASGPIDNELGAQCDVLYYNSVSDKCGGMSYIGPRVTRFCTEYESIAPTPNALNNSITALNSCLATCNPPTSSDRLMDVEHEEKRLLKRQSSKYRQYVNFMDCRFQCFDQSANINKREFDLMAPGEREIFEWASGSTLAIADLDLKKDRLPGRFEVDREEHDDMPNTRNITRFGIKNQRNQASEAKLLGDQKAKAITINQRTFPKLYNNSFDPSTHGYSQGYRTVFGNADNMVQDRTIRPYKKDGYTNAGVLAKSIQDYLNGGNRFVNLSGSRYDYMSPDASNKYWETIIVSSLNQLDLSCNSSIDVNICIAYSSLDNSCATCLSPDTQITMADDTNHAIKDLKEGDIVKSARGKAAKITEIVKIDWPELTLHNINNGKLRLTADHPIMTTKGWRAINYDDRKDGKSYKRYGMQNIGSLKVGDTIILEDKSKITIETIDAEAPVKDGVTYNLRLEEPHGSFYANGILVKSNQ